MANIEDLREVEENLMTTDEPEQSGRSPRFWPVINRETGEKYNIPKHVTIDYPSAVSILRLDRIAERLGVKGILNVATVFRMGAVLAAWLLGLDNEAAKIDLRWFFGDELLAYRQRLAEIGVWPDHLNERLTVTDKEIVIRIPLE